MKYCFVLLHYKVTQMTIDSINFIFESCKNVNFDIIVVDNNSGNDSLNEIKQSFLHKKNINYIQVERNVGFAKGNNIGYSVAKHTYNADFIVIMNNDVFIKEQDFCKKVEDLYISDKFDILGPDIVTVDGQHQNPVKDCISSKRELNKALISTRIRLLLVPFYNLKMKRDRNGYSNKDFTSEKRVGEPLHGSCLIYSKKYINNHEYAFYPDTFLYAEEDILYYLAKKEKLRLVYSPVLSVIHNEDASTDAVNRTNKEKKKFVLSNSLQSLLLFKKLMKSN